MVYCILKILLIVYWIVMFVLPFGVITNNNNGLRDTECSYAGTLSLLDISCIYILTPAVHPS